MSNSFTASDIYMKDGLPETKKQDKKNHGIGLKNVQELTEKNKGRFQIEVGENEFKVTLLLPLREQE